MPLLIKIFVYFSLFYQANPYLKKALKEANIIPFYQNRPNVVSGIDSFNNRVLRDSNLAMVSLSTFNTTFYTDFKYASPSNFTCHVMYTNPKAYLRLPVAKALQNALNALRKKGLTIKIFDAYRPYSVTEAIWKLVKDARYAADPAVGSNHNRGVALDVTLVNLQTGRELEMPTFFDDFSLKAHHDYNRLDPKILANRALLRKVMGQAGFRALSTEWWHYTFAGDNSKFSLLDLSFDDLKSITQ